MIESGSSTSRNDHESDNVDPDTVNQNVAINASISDLVLALKQAQKHADSICAHVQSFRNEAGIPAINEMRYASYHLTVSLSDDGNISDGGELLKAVRHFQRASYEAAEAGIMHALEQIDSFKKDYRHIPIGFVIPSWIDYLETCQEAQKHVGADREVGDDKILDHTKHRERFDELVKIVNHCEIAREDLNKHSAANLTQTRRFIIGSIIGVFAVIVAIVGVVIVI